jgi:hypothetical protein
MLLVSCLKGKIAMKHHLRTLTLWRLLIAFGLVTAASGADQQGIQLPKLAGEPPKELQIECRLTKTNLLVGEQVKIFCTLTNTTATAIPWRADGFGRFQAGTNWLTAVTALPVVIPQVASGSPPMNPLPPHTGVDVLLDFGKSYRPMKFNGRVIYDPVMRGVGIWGDEGAAKARKQWVYSNTFQYEVVAAERK